MLYLWMPEGQGAWRWWNAMAGSWQEAANWEQLLTDTSALAAREAMVFFPTSTAQLLRHPMTRQQHRQLGATGVRYLLEEYTLGSVDQLEVREHLSSDDQLTLLAMPQSQITTLVSSIALGPWVVTGLLPDFLLVPVAHKTPTLLLDGEHPVLRLDEWMALPADQPSLVLKRLPHISQLRVLGASAGDLSALPIEIDHAEDALAPTGIARSHPFNLVPRVERRGVSPYWGAIIAVALALLVTQLVYDGLRAWRYNQAATATKALNEQQFKAWFPQETHIKNLRHQLQAHLVNGGVQDTTALTLLSRVGPVLQQANLTARDVRYANQKLELTVDASNIAALDALHNQITAQGIKAELGSANPNGNRVTGILTVTP